MSSFQQNHAGGLERLCANDNAIVPGPTFPGLERIDVCMAEQTYAPHQHEDYAIGVTLAGVQSFHYRGEKRFSLPGNVLVLHPDETHDGGAGDEQRLYYRMLYLDPFLLGDALSANTDALPFVQNPIIEDANLRASLLRILGPINEPIPSLLADEIIGEIALGLCRHAQRPTRSLKSIASRQAKIAHDYLDDHFLTNVNSDDLEKITGLNRFSLVRHFRAVYAVTPHRYLTARRLQHARKLIESGMSLTKIAYESGFADQSHLNRHFRKSFGVTPGRWAKLVSAANLVSPLYSTRPE